MFCYKHVIIFGQQEHKGGVEVPDEGVADEDEAGPVQQTTHLFSRHLARLALRPLRAPRGHVSLDLGAQVITSIACAILSGGLHAERAVAARSGVSTKMIARNSRYARIQSIPQPKEFT